MTISVRKYLPLVAAFAGCSLESGSETKRIEVTEQSSLAITTLEVGWTDSNGDRIFNLNALTKEGTQVASVRRRIGNVTGVVLGETDEGSEVRVTVGEHELSALTYATGSFELDARQARDADVQEFLALPTVTKTLRSDAKLVVLGAPTAPTGETAFSFPSTSSCPTNYLLTAPVAGQCCLQSYSGDGARPISLLSTSGWTATGYEADGSQVPDYDAYGNAQWGGLAIDNSAATRFSTGTGEAANQSLVIDMHGCNNIERIALDAGASTGDYARGYNVLISGDGISWRQIVWGGAPEAQFQASNIGSGAGGGSPARFIKIVQLGSSGSWWSVHNFQAWGHACDDLSRTGWTATMYDAYGSQVPNYDAWGNAQWGGLAIDGSLSTRSSTGAGQAPGQALVVDMQSCFMVSRIVMDSGSSSGDYARGYEIYISNDGVNWGFSTESGTGSYSPIDKPFVNSELRGRYLKIRQTGSSGSWWSIHDLHVYGYPCSQATQLPGAITTFVRPADGATIQRTRNPTGQTCAGYGNETCAGANCYWGPAAAFSMAVIYPSGGYYTKVEGGYNTCVTSVYTSPPTPYWPDVTGTNATGQGCPGGGNGARRWDY